MRRHPEAHQPARPLGLPGAVLCAGATGSRWDEANDRTTGRPNPPTMGHETNDVRRCERIWLLLWFLLCCFMCQVYPPLLLSG